MVPCRMQRWLGTATMPGRGSDGAWLAAPCPLADAIELDYALVEDAGWGPGVGMTPGRMTPGRSPSHLHASPSQMASPGMSPFNDAIMFSPLGDGIMFSPGPATSPGYRWGHTRLASTQGGPASERPCRGDAVLSLPAGWA